MKEYYSINELAMITSLTTRTLRNHLRLGTLTGQKADGAWRFTPEDVDAFMANPAVRQSIQANHSAVVFDFLSDTAKRRSRACVILDYAVDIGEAARITQFYCDRVNAAHDVELRINRHRGVTRVILSGGEDTVADIMRSYYVKDPKIKGTVLCVESHREPSP